MRIKINDVVQFQSDNSYFFSDLKVFEDELEVYAISGNRKKVVLLLIDNKYLGFFDLNPKYITITDGKIDETWVYKKRYRYDGLDNKMYPEMVTLKLNNLFVPKWMLNETDFLYLVYIKTDLATEIFRNNFK